MPVKPFLDNKLHGVFATRTPRRPNSIGISVVDLEKVDGNILHVKDVDVVDGTPLLDLKPYVPEFYLRNVEHVGWLSKTVSKVYDAKSDERFR